MAPVCCILVITTIILAKREGKLILIQYACHTHTCLKSPIIHSHAPDKLIQFKQQKEICRHEAAKTWLFTTIILLQPSLLIGSHYFIQVDKNRSNPPCKSANHLQYPLSLLYTSPMTLALKAPVKASYITVMRLAYFLTLLSITIVKNYCTSCT